MDAPRYDSRAWTGEIGTPAPLPLHLEQRRIRPLRTGAQNGAIGHAFLLAVSPLLLVVSNWLFHASIADMYAGGPEILVPAMIVAGAGAVMMLLVARNILPRLCRWIALAGWIAMFPAAVAWLVFGAYAHQVAVAGPVVRAQIVSQHSQGRRAHIVISTFAFPDGSVAATTGYGGGARHCFAMRRLQGPYGFAWLRIVDASPNPGPGQLAWPIDRATCFSATPLAEMGR